MNKELVFKIMNADVEFNFLTAEDIRELGKELLK